MRAATYLDLVREAAYEIDALMRVQLKTIPSCADFPELWALRGQALRTIDLASVVMSALAPEDSTKESIAKLQVGLYGSSDSDDETER